MIGHFHRRVTIRRHSSHSEAQPSVSEPVSDEKPAGIQEQPRVSVMTQREEHNHNRHRAAPVVVWRVSHVELVLHPGFSQRILYDSRATFV